MISVDDALALVLGRAGEKPSESVDLEAALDLTLAEAVRSDVDSPPHDKALMDGYAVVAEDLRNGPRELQILEEITAGETPSRDVRPGAATRIMTGAPLPSGADAVVMVERTTASNETVRVDDSAAAPGQNILRQAASMRTGDVVLSAGKRLRPIEIGLLAEVGRSKVRVHPRPTVSILATGNELVEANQVPSAGQIRNSNGPMLAAQVRRAGGIPVELGIARDDRDSLSRLVQEGLKTDLLVLSGGVSAGILDLVPSVLADHGVERVFHKVNLKPGKPIWFGSRRDGESGQRTLVFGLPGNPVSSLVCFELFVRPALARLSGAGPASLPRSRARLASEHRQRGDRPTYFPAVLRLDGARPRVQPLAWKGSADLRTLADANCLACFPAGDRTFTADDEIDVLCF